MKVVVRATDWHTVAMATSAQTGLTDSNLTPPFRGLHGDTLAERHHATITRFEHEDLRADHRRAVASLAFKGLQIGRLKRQRERSEQQIRKAHRLIDALDVHVRQLESALRYVVDRWMSTLPLDDNAVWRSADQVLATIGTETYEGLSRMPLVNNSELESVLIRWSEIVFDIHHRPVTAGTGAGGTIDLLD